jgi:hypothetical protein
MIYFLEFDGTSFFVGKGAMDSCDDWRNIAIALIDGGFECNGLFHSTISPHQCGRALSVINETAKEN